jgi:hypothetical protein
LKRFAFFRVSKLTYCRPKEAVQSGPLPKTLPKGKPLLRQGMATPKRSRSRFTEYLHLNSQ